MGNEESAFTKEEIDEFEQLTYLTKTEIMNVWKSLVGEIDCGDFTRRFSADVVRQLPQLKVNPFGYRMVRVFSSLKDDQMSFEDFLDMLSVMSPNAPFDLKVYFVFDIYDLNEDGVLDVSDLNSIIDLLVNRDLSEEYKEKLIQKILEESDLDGDGISREEFGHLMTKCPDFYHSFQFSL